jgi:hypothetical protein
MPQRHNGTLQTRPIGTSADNTPADAICREKENEKQDVWSLMIDIRATSRAPLEAASHI